MALAATNHEAWKRRTQLEGALELTFRSNINADRPPAAIPTRRGHERVDAARQSSSMNASITSGARLNTGRAATAFSIPRAPPQPSSWGGELWREPPRPTKAAPDTSGSFHSRPYYTRNRQVHAWNKYHEQANPVTNVYAGHPNHPPQSSLMHTMTRLTESPGAGALPPKSSTPQSRIRATTQKDPLLHMHARTSAERNYAREPCPGMRWNDGKGWTMPPAPRPKVDERVVVAPDTN
uniref:Uncharacterized protein n=1 Tax=Chrysotila carterae TaxID=13221 RepID=A0A7S4C678_CHRCT